MDYPQRLGVSIGHPFQVRRVRPKEQRREQQARSKQLQVAELSPIPTGVFHF